MRIPDTSTLTASVTNWKAASLATALVVFGLIVSAISAGVNPPWLAAVVLGLGTTLVSLGLLSLFFELFLRRNVSFEMVRLVNIQKSVIEGQLAGVGKSRHVHWPTILIGRAEYGVLLLDPASWVDQNFHSLLESASRRVATIRVFLPDTSKLYCDEVATSLGREAEHFKASIEEAALQLSRLWDQESDRGKLKAGSKLTIRLLQTRPMYSLVTADDVTVVTITGVTGREGADPDYSFIYFGDPDQYPSAWFRRLLANEEQANTHFEKQVQAQEAQK